MITRLLLHLNSAILSLALSAAAIADPPGDGATAKDGVNARLDPIQERPIAPDFALSDPDGALYRLSDMRGTAVIVNFWATWCPPCRAEMPALQRAWERVREEGIQVLAVNVGEDSETIAEFASEVRIDLPLPMDTDTAVTQSWPMKGLPTTFVIDPQGRFAYRAEGERDWDDPMLLDLVRALGGRPATEVDAR